jgi:hypothetical protein
MKSIFSSLRSISLFYHWETVLCLVQNCPHSSSLTISLIAEPIIGCPAFRRRQWSQEHAFPTLCCLDLAV